MSTSLLLLPQTLMIAPCAIMVFALVKIGNLSPRWAILLGWLCTSGGIGLLALLDVDKTVPVDVLLNLLSGFGVGILLPALTLSAKHTIHNVSAAQTLMLLTYIRYLGSASGLVITGIVFQRVLRQNLVSTKFGSEAAELTKHAVTLMYSMRNMPDSQDKHILIEAAQDTLRTIWITLSIASAGVFLLSCATTLIVLGRKQLDKSTHRYPVSSADPPILKLEPVHIAGFERHFFDIDLDKSQKL
jgi:hypothetical protein